VAELRGDRIGVACRARHGVAILLKIYARCFDEQADAADQRITDALGTAEPEPAPAVKETTTASRHPEIARSAATR
jgi:hypothetical protein